MQSHPYHLREFLTTDAQDIQDTIRSFKRSQIVSLSGFAQVLRFEREHDALDCAVLIALEGTTKAQDSDTIYLD